MLPMTPGHLGLSGERSALGFETTDYGHPDLESSRPLRVCLDFAVGLGESGPGRIVRPAPQFDERRPDAAGHTSERIDRAIRKSKRRAPLRLVAEPRDGPVSGMKRAAGPDFVPPLRGLLHLNADEADPKRSSAPCRQRCAWNTCPSRPVAGRGQAYGRGGCGGCHPDPGAL